MAFSAKKFALRILLEAVVWIFIGVAVLFGVARCQFANDVSKEDRILGADTDVKASITAMREQQKLRMQAPVFAEAPTGTPISPEPQVVVHIKGALAGYTIGNRCPLWVLTNPRLGQPTLEPLTPDPIGSPRPVENVSGYSHVRLSPFGTTTAYAGLATPEIELLLANWMARQQTAEFYIIGPIYTEQARLLGTLSIPAAFYGITRTNSGIKAVVFSQNTPGTQPRELRAPLKDVVQMTGIKFFPR